MKASDALDALQALGDAEKAQGLLRFFKTGPGEYGEGDRFLGIRVPDLRKCAQTFLALPLSEIVPLLRSPFHEARFLGLLLLISAYKQGDPALQEQIFHLYLDNTRFINNWDLVDVSAEHIVGAFLKNRDKTLLEKLATSSMLWERRIAVIATFHYVKLGEFDVTLRIAERLLHDPEDLIHKATGWMLREIGKRDRPTEESFLNRHYRTMPRTMLRYAVEKFPEDLRLRYLRG